MTPKPQRIVCIGCGPTVIGFTYRLNQMIKNNELSPEDVQVTVLERTDEPGGLAGTHIDEHGFAWDLGGHVHGEPSKYECFQKALEGLPCEWNMLRRAAKADMRHIFECTQATNGQTQHNGTNNTDVQQQNGVHKNEESDSHASYVPYPVQQAVPLFPPEIRQQCIDDIRTAQQQSYAAKPANFDEWTDRVFGRKLKEIFVTPYNRKVWTVELSEMNAHWVGERVALVDVDRLTMLSMKTRQELLKDDLGWGPNTFFRYQKTERGSGGTWKFMVADHPKQWYKYRHEVTKVDSNAKVVTAFNSDYNQSIEFNYDVLITSIPITLFCGMIGIDVPRLQFSKVALVGLGLAHPQSQWAKETTWAYYPDPDIIFYRCTFLSNYNRCMTPDPEKYWSVLLEVGRKPDAPTDKEEILQKCVEGIIRSGIITNASQVVHRWYCLLPFGYPIPTVERDSELVKAHSQLEAMDIYSRGRFGGWKYEIANMDHSFAQGFELADRLWNAKPETVYKTGLQ